MLADSVIADWAIARRGAQVQSIHVRLDSAKKDRHARSPHRCLSPESAAAAAAAGAAADASASPPSQPAPTQSAGQPG